MNIAINISNADKSVYDAIKSILKMRPELDISIKKTKEKKHPLIKELEETKKAYKEGKIKAYDSAEEMHEAIMNEK